MWTAEQFNNCVFIFTFLILIFIWADCKRFLLRKLWFWKDQGHLFSPSCMLFVTIRPERGETVIIYLLWIFHEVRNMNREGRSHEAQMHNSMSLAWVNGHVESNVAKQVQSNLYLRTQLVKNGCTYCEKYLNRGMDSHRLTCKDV
jgi:hypothetical protein